MSAIMLNSLNESY